MFRWSKNYRRPLVDLPMKINQPQEYKIVFYPTNNKRPKIKFGDYEYWLYHKGLEGNEAYIGKGEYKGDILVIELIDDGKGKWAFHVEHKNQMILDSRLGKMLFDSALDCHRKCLTTIYEFYKKK